MLGFHKLPDSLHWWHPSVWVASGSFSGLLKPASGTWGSLLFFLLILPFWSSLSAIQHFWVILTLFSLGLLTIQHISQKLGSDDIDHSWIVIDEWAGLALTLLFAHTMPEMLVGFILFRFFDIVKPWPIKWLDNNIHGAFGVMFDDVAAGLAALMVLYGLQVFHVL